MQYLIQGFLLGLAYVAPIGVQNLFVINTSLTQPKPRVYATAFIIMFFDITLSVACFFGVGAIMSISPWIGLVVLGIGAVIVIMIGISLLRAKGSMEIGEDVKMPLMKVVGTACVVTWFNPQALIDGSMLLGAMRMSMPPEFHLIFITGVCLASAGWWFGLSTFVTFFRNKFTDKIIRMVNIVCGAIIVFYGIKLAVSFVKQIMLLF